MKVLELFSGIGGIHYALEGNGIEAEVFAVEINTVANCVYRHNFPSAHLVQKNILSMNVDEINKFSPEVLLMSPPCQPFTRVGLKKDLDDVRTDPLKYILSILPKLMSVMYVFIENVKGFENSEARNKLVSCLKNLEFDIQEFLISPTQIGIPNMRTRYYMLAKRNPLRFCFETSGIMETFPAEAKQLETLLDQSFQSITSVAEILETDDIQSSVFKDHLIKEEVLKKRIGVMDIVTKNSTKTCCFTKAYGHYVEGTGSVFCPFDQETIEKVFAGQSRSSISEEALRSLHLRFFTPREVARLMCFPDDRFSFPPTTTRKQQYRLLGNSVNVKVVALLIKLLLCQPDT